MADAHRALVDQVVEVDEELMSLYLEQGEIAPEQLHAPFEKALREGHLVPVCFVSRAHRRRAWPSCSTILVKLAPNPTGRQSAAVHQGRRRGGASSSAPSPIRRSTCSRTCSRS